MEALSSDAAKKLIEAGRTHIVLGSRKSQLALIQTNEIKERLQKCFPELQFTIKEMSTTGDKILDVPLSQIGDKGLFTKELEWSLLRKESDMAVHSLKDLPTRLPDGLALGAVSEREDSHDALVLAPKHKGLSLETLPAGSTIGTSSLRRIAQVKRQFPHLQFKDIRGNLNTRLRKLDEGEFDALILAVAGLKRLGMGDRVSQVIGLGTSLHAVGQGAYGVECRADDSLLIDLLRSSIHHPATATSCMAERAFLRELEGGCQVPVGVATRLEANRLHLSGIVLSVDGSQSVKGEIEGDPADADKLGHSLALQLKEEGADVILREIYTQHRAT